MKIINKILILNIIILFISTTGLITSVYLANNIISLEESRDYASIQTRINETTDIEWQRNLSSVMLKERQNIYSRNTAWHNRIAIYQTIIGIACFISLFLIFKLRTQFLTRRSSGTNNP